VNLLRKRNPDQTHRSTAATVMVEVPVVWVLGLLPQEGRQMKSKAVAKRHVISEGHEAGSYDNPWEAAERALASLEERMGTECKDRFDVIEIKIY